MSSINKNLIKTAIGPFLYMGTGIEIMEKEDKYLRAKKRIEEVKKFYNHLFSTIFVITLTGGINYYLDKWENPWFLWVVFGMGIGLVFHASKTYGLNLFLGKGWEERKIKEFMDQEENQKRWE